MTGHGCLRQSICFGGAYEENESLKKKIFQSKVL